MFGMVKGTLEKKSAILIDKVIEVEFQGRFDLNLKERRFFKI